MQKASRGIGAHVNKALGYEHIIIYVYNDYDLKGVHFSMNMLIMNLELLSERECQYVIHLTTHVDFLIYNRIHKKPAVVIEIDGLENHRETTEQVSRDLMKDHILDLYEIPLLRFKTNGSMEKEQLLAKLDEIMV